MRRRALFAGLREQEAPRHEVQVFRGAPQALAGGALEASPGLDLLEVIDRAQNPEDALELRDLYLSRLQAQLDGGRPSDREAARRWTGRPVLRHSTVDDVLRSRAVVRFVKELYNCYFRDQLYGTLRSPENVILSSGATDETQFGLPRPLLECLRCSLDRGWYGYASSLGRLQTREAIAQLENSGLSGQPYSPASVAITLGGTFAVSSLADFILGQRGSGGEPALCAIPNYPPMVESVARRAAVRLVALTCGPRLTSLRPLIASLGPDTPLVLLQTVTNPTGTPVDEGELEELILGAGPSTIVLLDEAHETLGAPVRRSKARTRDNVVRVISLSKTLSTPGMKLGWVVGAPALIDEFYEYASSTYGGPPSLYYLLLEVMARMERWMREGIVDPGREQLMEFESSYGIDPADLAHAFSIYVKERGARDSAIVAQREYAVARLAAAGATVINPGYSINVSLRPPRCSGSFRWFREALTSTHVSTYPSILAFDLSDRWARITIGREPHLLHRALDRLAQFMQ